MKQEAIDNLNLLCDSIAQTQIELDVKIKGLFHYVRGICASNEQEQSREKTGHAETSNENLEVQNNMKYKNVKIYQRGDNKLYYARIPLGESKYLSVTSKTQVGCYNKLKAYLDSPRKLQNKVKELPSVAGSEIKQTSSTALCDFYQKWLEIYKIPTCKKTTVQQLNNMWKNWIYKYPFAKKQLKDITTIELQEFLSTIPHDRLRKQLYYMLGDILGKAEILDLIRKNPTKAIIPPKYRSTERGALTKKEEIDFVKIAHTTDCWAIFALMLYEGLRTAEAKAIRHCDIKDDYIIVDKAIDAVGEFTTTKNYKSRRVPIFAQFKSLADELRSSSDEKLIVGARKHTANDIFLEIATEIKLPHTMYSLRHTFATRCAENEISPKQVQLWLGHSDVSMTLHYYTNINSEFEKKNIAKKGI
ncbi:MAG: tyrosine-type recombinase/integrase [Oscillospiraceae bacterium]